MSDSTKPLCRGARSPTDHSRAAEALFAAWTDPHSDTLWDLRGDLHAAEVDLRVVEVIASPIACGWLHALDCREFELIEPPSRLIYSWRLEIPEAGTERVSVSFVPATVPLKSL